MKYLEDSETILGSLSSSCCCLWRLSGASALFDGFPRKNGMNTALIYRDYYFTEACPRLQNVLDGKPGLACIARRRSRTLELGDNAGRLCVPRLRRHGVV